MEVPGNKWQFHIEANNNKIISLHFHRNRRIWVCPRQIAFDNIVGKVDIPHIDNAFQLSPQ